MKLKLFTVDAFTGKPFTGNPAAVVPHLHPLDEKTLQKVAAELNLSETAYVQPTSVAEEPWTECSRFTLRWFTPTNEVPLCGHATLATAHVLFICLGNKNQCLEFETASGVLVARRSGEQILLDFPANPPAPLTPAQEQVLAPLLQVASGGLRVDSILHSPTTKKLLLVLHPSCSRQELESLKVDVGAWPGLHDGSLVKGVILSVTGEAGGPYHCYSRYFAPWNGIPEDPVTGSAHTVLGPYWAQQLGVSQLKCRQCSPRGGDVGVTVRGDGRVDLAGHATTVLEGHLHC